MTLPYDPVSLAVAALAGMLLLGAASRSNVKLRLSLILLAALVIRVDASWQHSLNEWDERFHALVAKNLISDPLTPTLYRSPAIAYDYRDWTSNHVWSHKPPAALWMMAASMRVFGVNEIAMRLPSVLLSTGAVLLTFLIGRVLFEERVALLAAGFHAVNGFLVALSAGRRVAEHVDTALIFFVALGIWTAIRARKDPRIRDLVLTGVALGLAGLSKSAPALLILPVAFVAFLQQSSLRVAATRVAAIGVIGLVIVAPWTLYIASTFPDEARWSGTYTLMHIIQPLEGPPTSPFAYLLELPRFFGELVWIPLLAVMVTAVRSARNDLRLVLIWVAIPYLTFSLMSTRLPGYVMIAAPAVFLIEAQFWVGLKKPSSPDRQTTDPGRRDGLARPAGCASGSIPAGTNGEFRTSRARSGVVARAPGAISKTRVVRCGDFQHPSTHQGDVLLSVHRLRSDANGRTGPIDTRARHPGGGLRTPW